MHRITAEGLLLFLLIAGSGALTADEAKKMDGEPPSVELLEFLGGFETPEGEWFDPLLLVEQSQNQAETRVTSDD